MDLYFAVIDFKKTRQVNLWKIIPKLPNYSSWSVLALPGMSQHVVMDVLSKEHRKGTATATFAWNFSRWPLQDPVKHVLPPGEDDEASDLLVDPARDWDAVIGRQKGHPSG